MYHLGVRYFFDEFSGLYAGDLLFQGVHAGYYRFGVFLFVCQPAQLHITSEADTTAADVIVHYIVGYTLFDGKLCYCVFQSTIIM